MLTKYLTKQKTWTTWSYEIQQIQQVRSVTGKWNTNWANCVTYRNKAVNRLRINLSKWGKTRILETLKLILLKTYPLDSFLIKKKKVEVEDSLSLNSTRAILFVETKASTDKIIQKWSKHYFMTRNLTHLRCFQNLPQVRAKVNAEVRPLRLRSHQNLTEKKKKRLSR